MIQYFTIPIALLFGLLAIYKGYIRPKREDLISVKIKLHTEASVLAFTASTISFLGLLFDQIYKSIYGHYIYFF